MIAPREHPRGYPPKTPRMPGWKEKIEMTLFYEGPLVDRWNLMQERSNLTAAQATEMCDWFFMFVVVHEMRHVNQGEGVGQNGGPDPFERDAYEAEQTMVDFIVDTELNNLTNDQGFELLDWATDVGWEVITRKP